MVCGRKGGREDTEAGPQGAPPSRLLRLPVTCGIVQHLLSLSEGSQYKFHTVSLIHVRVFLEESSPAMHRAA